MSIIRQRVIQLVLWDCCVLYSGQVMWFMWNYRFSWGLKEIKKLTNLKINAICARISINNNSLKKVLRSLKIKYKTGHSDTNIINVSKTHSVPENYFKNSRPNFTNFSGLDFSFFLAHCVRVWFYNILFKKNPKNLLCLQIQYRRHHWNESSKFYLRPDPSYVWFPKQPGKNKTKCY